MKKCQIGTMNYDAANTLHAECYGAIGGLLYQMKKVRDHLVDVEKHGGVTDLTQEVIREMDQVLR